MRFKLNDIECDDFKAKDIIVSLYYIPDNNIVRLKYKFTGEYEDIVSNIEDEIGFVFASNRVGEYKPLLYIGLYELVDMSKNEIETLAYKSMQTIINDNINNLKNLLKEKRLYDRFKEDELD